MDFSWSLRQQHTAPRLGLRDLHFLFIIIIIIIISIFFKFTILATKRSCGYSNVALHPRSFVLLWSRGTFQVLSQHVWGQCEGHLWLGAGPGEMAAAGVFACGARHLVSEDVGGAGLSQLPLPVPLWRRALPVGERCLRDGPWRSGTEDGATYVAKVECLPGDFAICAAPGSCLQFGMSRDLLWVK